MGRKESNQTNKKYPRLVLVLPRKSRSFITERLLMGRKESNRTNKQNTFNVLAQGHNAMTSVRLEPAAPRSQPKGRGPIVGESGSYYWGVHL